MTDPDEGLLKLTPEGAVDVARWAVKAFDSGHFDWQKLCGDNEPENVAERWRLVSWLNDMKLLDGPLPDMDSPDDREIAAAMMLSFLFNNVRQQALAEGISPEQVMAG